MKRPIAHRILLTLLAATLFVTRPLLAQSAPSEDQKLAELEKQIKALRDAVEELRKASAPAVASATRPTTAPTTVSSAAGQDPMARIRDEGMNRSQVMKTLSYLTNVIGPRLTGSPGLKKANEWTRDQLTSWGLQNARLEPWGPFGRGWSLKRFSAQVVEPQAIPLIAWPKAWSPGFEQPLTAEVVCLDARTEEDLKKFEGKVKGKIVLTSPARDVPALFDAQALRTSETELLRLANADVGAARAPGMARSLSPTDRQAQLANTPVGRLARPAGNEAAAAGNPATPDVGGPATQPSDLLRPGARPTTGPTTRGSGVSPARVIAFLQKEGAALVVSPSTQGSGGTLYVASVTMPVETRSFAEGGGGPRPWNKDAPATPPQITVAAEDYNRLCRMIDLGVTPKMTVDLQAEFHNDDDGMQFNTIAEIPGTDLKDEIVMLGAHLDSWHSGTGATDNGAGCAAVMEAVRIIKALDLKPRRTIRIGLWTGEEQGIFGSKAYVTKHFGHVEEPAPTTRPTTGPAGRGGRGGRGGGVATAGPTTRPTTQATGATTRPARRIVKLAGHEKFQAYFNLDNGTGKIRGVYLQGNEAVRPIFRKWLAPFADLGAETLTLANTGGTDHLSFDAVGLPGFQFIQDPIEYWSRTHHSNADVYDRIQPEDMKQASTIIAAFAYNAAMMEEKLPRKPER